MPFHQHISSKINKKNPVSITASTIIQNTWPALAPWPDTKAISRHSAFIMRIEYWYIIYSKMWQSHHKAPYIGQKDDQGIGKHVRCRQRLQSLRPSDIYGIIVSDNDLSPVRHQFIIGTNVDLSMEPLEIYFSEIWIRIGRNVVTECIDYTFTTSDSTTLSPVPWQRGTLAISLRTRYSHTQYTYQRQIVLRKEYQGILLLTDIS